MISEQRHFWRTWLAWWIDGCPAPETWYRMRLMGENLDRLSRIIGSRLAPTIEQAAASLNALLRAWQPGMTPHRILERSIGNGKA